MYNSFKGKDQPPRLVFQEWLQLDEEQEIHNERMEDEGGHRLYNYLSPENGFILEGREGGDVPISGMTRCDSKKERDSQRRADKSQAEVEQRDAEGRQGKFQIDEETERRQPALNVTETEKNACFYKLEKE